MDLKDIQNLIRFISKSGVSEVKLETDEMSITVKNEYKVKNKLVTTQHMPVLPTPPANQDLTTHTEENSTKAVSETSQEEGNDTYIEIKSPMIGTFYRRPSPDKELFVEVGSKIKVGDVVCVIEAMKLFNHVESEVSGKIVKILVDDSSPVEFDQPLFLVDPS